ncbi:lipopolysaccharide biosynthesis protein [Ferrigenium sp. UT4]
MRRLLGNFGHLVRGRGIAAVMQFGSIVLMARALGPIEFGMVVLMQSYVLLVRGLLDFRLFEAVIRVGVPLHDTGDTSALRRLVKVCHRVDLRASLAATALALIGAPLAGPLMSISSDHVVLLAAYSLVLLSSGNSTAGGILRLYDQFDLIGRLMTIAPTIRFFGVLLAWWFDAPLGVFVVILAGAFVTDNLFAHYYGRQIFRQHVGRPPEGERMAARLSDFPGLRHFIWVTYWQSNMDIAPKHLAMLLAGYLLGPAEAGLLRMARDFSSLLSKASVLIREVALPDLTRHWQQRTHAFAQVAYSAALLGGALGLLFVLAGYFLGDLLLGVLLGKAYMAAAPILTLLLLAATFDLAASPLRAASYAIGHAGKVLRMYVVSTMLYLFLFVVLSAWMGLVGACAAACIAAALPLLFMVMLIRKSIRRRDL